MKPTRLQRLQAEMREREARQPKWVYKPEALCRNCERGKHQLCDGCECSYCREHLDVPRKKVANVSVGA